MLRPMIASSYFLGAWLGFLKIGGVCNRFGPKIIIFVCLHLTLIIGWGMTKTVPFAIFLLFRFLQGFFLQILLNTSLATLVERFPSRARALGFVWITQWTIGCTYTSFVAYCIGDFQNIHFALIFPYVVIIFGTWQIPNIHVRTLAIGGITTKDETTPAEADPVNSATHEGLLTTSAATMRILILASVWFICTFSYFGIYFYLPFVTEIHLVVVIGVLVDASYYVQAGFMFPIFGKRLPTIVYHFYTALCCAFLAFVVWSGIRPDRIIDNFMISSIMFTSKASVVSCLYALRMYTEELLPPTHRTTALTLCGVFAMAGSVLAPYLNVFGEYTTMVLPLVLLSALGFVCGLLSTLLPESPRD